jgi:chromosome segregation ATPase
MEPPIDPGDHSVSELEEVLEQVDDPAALDAILEAERDGKDRTTAIDAIEDRLGDVETSIAESRDGVQPVDGADDEVLTISGPDEGRQMSERLLTDLSGIRSTLEEARRTGGQYEARLRKLENEVGDLAAYAGALEEFLDEDGTAQQLLEDVKDDLAALEDDVDDVKPVVRSHARTLRANRVTLADLEDELEGQGSTLADVVEDFESLDARVARFREEAAETHEGHADRIASVEGDLDEQASRLDDVAGEVESVGDAVGDVEADLQKLDESVGERFAAAADDRAETVDRVEANADSIDGNATEIDRLAGDVDDLGARLGDTDRVDDRFERIEEGLAEIQEWRDQLGSVLGGGMAPQDESDD